MNVVVDTNVAVAANFRTSHASEACINNCINRLRKVVSRDIVFLDSHGYILDEYLNNLSLAGQGGVGDYFVKWLFQNQANPERCIIVEINPLSTDGTDFEEFPRTRELSRFHRKDRKFVAVALASGENPTILNAVDTGWWNYRNELADSGVHVEFVCPDMMARRRRR